jgi:hypothetical protein
MQLNLLNIVEAVWTGILIQETILGEINRGRLIFLGFLG